MLDITAPSSADNSMLSQARSGNVEHSADRLHRMSAHSARDVGKIKEAAQEFEAVFISQMLEHMFAGVETNELFGGGEAEDIYRSMMVDEYGKLMAKSGGVGVADHVTRQLLQEQEARESL
jgi:peptidoglycan hydrolase FlgJ